MVDVIEHLNLIQAIAIVSIFLSIYYFFSLLIRLRKLKFFAASGNIMMFLLLACFSGFLSMIILGTQGYRALTKELPVATVEISSTSNQMFDARLKFANGEHQIFAIKGDELMIDAYILKWKPWANLLGLHTAYRLQRISGRYTQISDEKSKQRSVFAIKNKGGVGIAEWRKKIPSLSFLVDVEHGSASFVKVENGSKFQLFVTTDGLLIRPLE